jgi:hypothetical protein
MVYDPNSFVMVPYEVMHGKPGDPVCRCLEGLPPYLEVFSECDRDRVFSVLGPHPLLTELLATIRLARVADARLSLFAFEAVGNMAVVAPSERSWFQDIAAFNHEVTATDSLGMFCGITQVLGTSECATRDMFTSLDTGYCYLDLYPRTEWFHLGNKLGAWPTASMLPSGRFPAKVTSRTASAFGALCHVQRIADGLDDQLVGVGGGVHVGGRKVVVPGGRGLPKYRALPQRHLLSSGDLVREYYAISRSCFECDHFFFKDVPPDTVSDVVDVQPGHYTVVRPQDTDRNLITFTGPEWVLFVPPGCSVTRGGFVFSPGSRYLWIHGKGAAAFRFTGSVRYFHLKGSDAGFTDELLTRFDSLRQSDYSTRAAHGLYVSHSLVDHGPDQDALYRPSAAAEFVSDQTLADPPGRKFTTQVVDSAHNVTQWYARLTRSGAYFEPDGVALVLDTLVVLPGSRVRVVSLNTQPGSAEWIDVIMLAGVVRSSRADVFGQISRAMSPVALGRGVFPPVPDGACAYYSWCLTQCDLLHGA